MASTTSLQRRLVSLSACSESLDVRSRSAIVAVAFDTVTPSQQFLSDLYDACVLSIAALEDSASETHSDGRAMDGHVFACEEGTSRDLDAHLRVTCVAAALFYLTRQDGHVVQQFLEAFFLPLLAHGATALPDKACRLQACAGLVTLLSSKGLWQQLRHVVDACCNTLDTAAAAVAASAAAVVINGKSGGCSYRLPLHVTCELLTVVVQQLCLTVQRTDCREADRDDADVTTLRWVLSRLRSALRPLLLSPWAPARQAALKSLVPITLKSAQACGGSDLVLTAQQVWQVALELMGVAPGGGVTAASAVAAGGEVVAANAGTLAIASGGADCGGSSASACSARQRSGLALLVTSRELMAQPAAGVDVAGCGEFWEMLRTCLSFPADVDALERKRAMLLLQHLSPPGQMDQPGWALWVVLYDILDEFPIHLIAPVWTKIDQLHAPAVEFHTEAVVPKSYIPRKKELKQRKPGSDTATPAAEGDSVVTSSVTSTGSSGATAPTGASLWLVPQPWQCVLWARVLQHGNIQVQRLGMRTFLQRDWRQPGVLQQVPVGFVAGVLLPALTRDIHYRGGDAEADVLDVQALSAAWLRSWFTLAIPKQRMEGLLAVRGLVGSGSDVSRLGLLQLMKAVAAAAVGACADGQLLLLATDNRSGGSGGGGGVKGAGATFSAAMLGVLRAVLVYTTNFTGVPYKWSIWRSVLRAAAATAPVAAGEVGGCLRLLQELPPATLDPGGQLREQARSWLLGRQSASEGAEEDDGPPAANLSRHEVAAVVGWLQDIMDDFWSTTQNQGQITVKVAAATAMLQQQPSATAAATVVQLLLLFDDLEAACGAVVVRLQNALYGIYGRPYLQAAESHRALLLLRELLVAVTRLASVPSTGAASGHVPSPAGLSSLQSSVMGLIVYCCEDLCSAASHAADSFLEAQPPAAAGGLDRASAAWSCVALSLSLACRSPAPDAAPATCRLASTLLALLSRLSAHPLPPRRLEAVATGLRIATSATEALRQAAACSSQVRKMVSEQPVPAALAAAALHDTIAASTTAEGGDTAEALHDVSALLADVEAARWPLLDAATALAAAVGGPRGPLGQGAVGELSANVVVEVLVQSVAALNEYPEGQVMPLLRCLRRCWAAVALGGQELQTQAAKALGVETALADAAEAGNRAAVPLEALCWPVVRALWNALCATPRRTGPLCAAFVNTAMMSCLFVQQSGVQLEALHGDSGPCHWLLSRLLERGGSSSRFLLLMACQLGAFLPLQPELVGCYCREIQLVLLWGSRKGSTYDPDGSPAEGPESEELAAVATPMDPTLLGSPAIGTEVAPRVALLCGLHKLAENAGAVWPPPPPPPPPPPLTSISGTVTLPPPHRPVIIFGETSLWEEGDTASPAPLPPSAPSTKPAATSPDAGNLPDYGSPPPSDPKSPSLVAGQLLWRQLLSLVLTDPLLSSDKVRNGSELHRQKVRAWQSLVVLTGFVPRGECGGAVEAMLGQVNGNNPPTVKQYVEAVVAALVLREPSLLQQQILPMLSSYSRHQTGLGSYILIAAQVLMHSPPEVQCSHLRPLMLAMCPWLMCHSHNVRTYAQLVMWALLQRFPPQDPVWAHSMGDLTYLHRMLDFMHTNADLVRLRRNIGDPILHWSPAAMSHPARVFASAPDGVCLAGSAVDPSSFEGAAPTLVDRIQSFLVAERHRLRGELSERATEREFAPQDPNINGIINDNSNGETAAGISGSNRSRVHRVAGTAAVPEASVAVTATVGTAAGGGIGDFQRKIKPEALMATLTLQWPGADAAAGEGGSAGGVAAFGEDGELVALLEAEEAEEQDWKSHSGRRRLRHDVLLVASLIDKLPNLAGLARTCEVLGAGRLVLADLAATREPVFTSVSVTAEQWLPIEEVKPAALLAWLERRAAEGYTLVGLEQTAESVNLPDYHWPPRVVLVLGREKEGIPPEVLGLLDLTLEIPQRGIIRSLNVHVSGAIALYEYVRQMQGLGLLAARGGGG